MNNEPELITLYRVDGKELHVGNYGADVRWLVSGGYAMPPVDFATFRGYRQAGSSLLAAVPAPRQITANLWHSPVCSRDLYWQARNDLVDFFRPNVGGPITLVVRLPGGAMRAIDVRGDPGPIFPPYNPTDDVWHIEESLQFIALDPIWYDFQPTEFTLAPSVQSALVFPITFPITFGFDGGVYDTGVIDYQGTYEGWTWIKLQGPYTWARIVNASTGAVIFMSVALSADDVRFLDLRNQPIILDLFGNSCFSELGVETNLVDFNPKPAPAAATRYTISLANSTAQSGVYMAVYERWIGI